MYTRQTDEREAPEFTVGCVAEATLAEEAFDDETKLARLLCEIW